MTIIEISPKEQSEIFQIVASILHMGNVGFTEEEGKAKILKPESVRAISKVRFHIYPLLKLLSKEKIITVVRL